jgi:DNA polymerase-3 subunit epsilon
MTRQIVLDTETTGRSAEQNRIIEIGAIEVVDRELTDKSYHVYINPHQEVEAGALSVHGLTNEFLADKPAFKDIVQEFMDFIEGAELIIHNAPFDVGFINAELARNGYPITDLSKHCGVLDTLPLARKKHPGQRNILDALCKRYEVDNSGRSFHGALLDSCLLADVYLRMTGGQKSLFMGGDGSDAEDIVTSDIRSIKRGANDSPVIITPNADQIQRSDNYF